MYSWAPAPVALTSETASPLILTPASSQGSSNTNNERVTVCSAVNQTPFAHPMSNSTPHHQNSMNVAGFAHPFPGSMQPNTHLQAHPMMSQEDQAAYIQNLAYIANQNSLNMPNGELPFGSHIGQMASDNSAANNAASFSDRLRQPYVRNESEEVGLEACSNSAVCGSGGLQGEVAGSRGREMDFTGEWQRARYINGLGLPDDGTTAEERLLRAINMNHYILVGHINGREREMKEYVHANVNKIVDHSQHTLWKKLHLMQQKVDNLSKNSVKEPRPPQSSFISPSSTRVSPRSPILSETEVEEDRSLIHLELAILKLWAHIDKIKAENQLRSEEKAERKELEELIASELLYHNHTMERMQGKINSMTKEVACCWTEIKKLQDSVKGLESGATVKVPGVKANSGVTATGVAATSLTPASASGDPTKMLEKINEELENLMGKNNDKRGEPQEEEYECACDLCGKARAGKSVGVTVEDKEDYSSAAPQAAGGPSVHPDKLKGTKKGKENATSSDQASGSSNGSKLGCTVRKCLGALNLKPIASTIITNVTPSSPIADKWRDVYSRSKQGNQSIVEMRRSNGDLIILLAEPSQGAENIAMIIGQDVADSLVDIVTIGLIDFQVGVTEGINSNVNLVAAIPVRSESERNSTPEWGRAQTQFRLPGAFNCFPSQPGPGQTVQSQLFRPPFAPFAPLPEVARDTTSITRHLHQPKFGSYGFPWVETSEKCATPLMAKSTPSTSRLGGVLDKRRKESLVDQTNSTNETQQKNAKDHQSSYCDRLRERESRIVKENKEEQISTGKMEMKKEKEKERSRLQPINQSNGQNENEPPMEKGSMDSVLAAINAALTKMSDYKKMSEGGVGENTMDVGAVPGSSTLTNDQDREQEEQKKQMEKKRKVPSYLKAEDYYSENEQ